MLNKPLNEVEKINILAWGSSAYAIFSQAKLFMDIKRCDVNQQTNHLFQSDSMLVAFAKREYFGVPHLFFLGYDVRIAPS